MPATPEITNDVEHERFVTTVDGVEGELVYHRNGDRLVLVHTGVPDEIGGKGIAGALVRTALDYAREHDLTVVPNCPYAKAWLDRHPDVAATVKLG